MILSTYNGILMVTLIFHNRSQFSVLFFDLTNFEQEYQWRFNKSDNLRCNITEHMLNNDKHYGESTSDYISKNIKSPYPHWNAGEYLKIMTNTNFINDRQVNLCFRNERNIYKLRSRAFVDEPNQFDTHLRSLHFKICNYNYR
jgi:hypothetical protein